MATATAPENQPAVTGVVASINLSDAAAASELYQRAFAAEELARLKLDGDEKIIHCHLRINGADVFIADPFPEHGQPLKPLQGFRLHLQVDDADAWFARALAAGLEVVMPIDLMFWGDRYGQVRDRFGVVWSIGGPNR